MVLISIYLITKESKLCYFYPPLWFLLLKKKRKKEKQLISFDPSHIFFILFVGQL